MPELMTKQDAIETLENFRNDYTREGSQMCRAIDIVLGALKQPTIEPEVRHGRWIPCSERLPEEETDVIAVIDGCSREAFYSDSSFIGSNFYRNAEEVTYWMPKPEPPEASECNR